MWCNGSDAPVAFHLIHRSSIILERIGLSHQTGRSARRAPSSGGRCDLPRKTHVSTIQRCSRFWRSQTKSSAVPSSRIHARLCDHTADMISWPISRALRGMRLVSSWAFLCSRSHHSVSFAHPCPLHLMLTRLALERSHDRVHSRGIRLHGRYHGRRALQPVAQKRSMPTMKAEQLRHPCARSV